MALVPRIDDVLDSHVVDLPPLRDPIALVAFEGWFDAAQVATTAVSWCLADRTPLTVASIDSDPFFDFTQRRPEVFLDADDVRHIRWPVNDIVVVRDPNASRDVVALCGVEPHMYWPTFVECIVRTLDQLHCTTVVTVGAALDATPHTRTPLVTGSSLNARLSRTFGLDRPSYQGPTGVIGVLHERLERDGIDTISLRVGVPHYLAESEHPKSTAAMLRFLERVLGLPTRHADLYEEIQRWTELHDSAIEDDDDVRAYVTGLEAEYDRLHDAEVPSGEDLSDEIERYLRDRDDDPSA